LNLKTHPSIFEPSPPTHYILDLPSDGNTPYGLKALSAECNKVANAPPGTSHDAMRDAALKLKGLELAGHLSEKWRDRFWFAARHRGKSNKEIQELLDFGEANGKARDHLPNTRVKQDPCTITETREENDTHGHSTDTHGPHLWQPCVSDPQPCVSEAQSCVSEAQSCVSFSEDPQPCVSPFDPQPCVSFLDEDTRSVIGKHILFDDATKSWSEALWDLRRELDPVARKNTWNVMDWRAVVAYWSEASKGNGVNLPGPDSVWAEFKRKLKADPRKPYGSELALVEEMVPEVTVPSELQGTTYEPVFRVMNVLAKLAAERGGDTFYVPCRLVAEKAKGMNHKTAHRHLGVLCKYGFLSLVKAGTPGTGGNREANLYQWHDPPCPGKSVWNGNKQHRDG